MESKQADRSSNVLSYLPASIFINTILFSSYLQTISNVFQISLIIYPNFVQKSSDSQFGFA